MPESPDITLPDLIEVKRRREMRADLNAWAIAVDPEHPPALHHRFINDHLMKVERGEIKKLAIFLPPGSAKSTYSSVNFPPWFLQRQKDRVILALSHSADLVKSFGRRCRNMIDLNEKIIHMGLRNDSTAVDDWATNTNCSYLCAGVGSGIAGRRADLCILDDVIGKKEDADSEQYRAKLWQWYSWDVKPRLKPNARTVMIQTRWHEDDLAGRLLNKDSPFYEGDEWTVINIPLIAEINDPLGRAVGDLLWPEWFNAATLKDAMKDADAFNSLYQQNPVPKSGNYFKAEWLQTYTPEQLPSNLRYYACSDHALGKKEDNDLSCMMVIGLDTNSNIYVLPDMVWSQLDTLQQVNEMLRLNALYRPISWWVGKEHITTSIGPFLNQMMAESHNYISLVETPSLRDLVSRAQPIKGRMQAMKVFFPGFAPWWPSAKAQLLSFDRGTHDDVVAALSEAGRGLADMFPARVEVIEEEIATEWAPTMRWMKDSMSRKSRLDAVWLADR